MRLSLDEYGDIVIDMEGDDIIQSGTDTDRPCITIGKGVKDVTIQKANFIKRDTTIWNSFMIFIIHTIIKYGFIHNKAITKTK